MITVHEKLTKVKNTLSIFHLGQTLNVNIRSLRIIKISLGSLHKHTTILKETYTFWTCELGSINLKFICTGNQVLLHTVPLLEDN